MTPNDDQRDEDLIASFLNTVERDMAPPDPAFLDRLREQSADAYRSAFAAPQYAPPPRRRRLVPWVAAGLAAAVLVGVGVYLLRPPRPAGGPFGDVPPTPRPPGALFGDVLRNAAAADSLRLKVVQEGDAGEAWVEKDRLRRDHADGTYEIAKADRLWVVDEKDNRVTPRPSPYFRKDPAAGVNLLALLGLDAEAGPEKLVRQRPAGRRDQDGADYLVYRVDVPRPDGKVAVEALVEAGTLRLHSVQAQAEKDGKSRPLGELTVLAWDEKVPERKFVVKDTLTEDGRVGKVVDVQGVVSVRPVMQQRWTPVGDNTLLKPGDWVRTDVRGANAVMLRLVKQTTLVLGPGALVEVVRPDQVRVHQGEVEANVPQGDSLDLVSLGGESFPVKGRLLYRFEEGRVVRLEKEPGWLRGFKGTVPQESLGSLLARVDGRDVPLTVGYHKVTVDIRDQIARTTIEESFVNHTDGVLEGVFHFPLPQDASISGFGMWIGDNLVEADVVEKQRAREIYETILTEKRDPGLLEWTGGNVFKARVYPIPGQSEKRIKITYTQVLPLRDGRYRYSYALQSEMLKQHPLRQLDLDVKVASALPLRSVTSPTHTTRNELTEHAAHVEFSAQEYVPTRDFEVVVEVDGKKQSPVVLIPHRRGDDGYFLLQVLPPAAEAGPERTLVPDGPPLRLVVLADTSASMDAGQRAQQAEFIAALLGSLTPKDTINLACCDVDCDWAFERPQPAAPQHLLEARQFLAQRTSLGWTDLDRAFASAFRQCEPGTQVLYIGDGVVTTGDADPVAFAQRLRRLHQEQGRGAVCHAVAVGSMFEPAVMAAVGSLGGGSARRLTGEQGPVAAAREWLREAARPGLRDLKVEFKGLRTARVYPEELPNLPAGSQQIVLGRYLPEGKDQSGEVIVTGRLGNQPVRYSTHVTLKDAEEGNSFIPRLWVRMHLDRLLAQGSSSAVRDEVIALSEEYQIITPYTSLLVLESDADRERFGVKRSFHMRDGEKFFAEGRSNAEYELLQKQMKRAGDWRLGLRRLVLRELASLGRDPRALQVRRVVEQFGRPGGVGGGMLMGIDDTRSDSGPAGSAPGGGPVDGTYLGDFAEKDALGEPDRGDLDVDRKAAESDAPPVSGGAKDEKDKESEPEESAPLPEPDEQASRESPVADYEGKALKKLQEVTKEEPLVQDEELVLGVKLSLGRRGVYDRLPPSSDPYGSYFKGTSRIHGGWYSDPRPAFDSLFPSLAPPPGKPKEKPSSWSAAARELARTLLRTEKLAALTGGVEVARETEHFNAHRARLSQRSRRLELFTPDAWLTRSENDRSATVVQWCDGRERGALSRAFRLGRLRAASAEEAHTPPLELTDFSLESIERSYGGYGAKVEPQGKDRVTLILQHPNAPTSENRFVVDTSRHVLLSIEQRQQDRVTATTTFADFVEAAGCWWARKVETTDDKGRRVMLTTQTVKDVSADEVRGQMRKELAGREQVQFLREPLPRVADAKRALQAGKAGFEDHVALLRHFAAIQQWTRALEQLDRAEALAGDKPGMRWMRDAFLSVSRRHEELRKRHLDEAEEIARSPRDADGYARTEHVVGQAAGVLSAPEMLLLLDRLRPVYEARPPQVMALKRWAELRVSYLQQAGRGDEALRLQKQLAVDYPQDMERQRQYAQVLAGAGDWDAAYDWLKRALAAQAGWSPDEEDALRDQYAAMLYQQGRYTDLVDYLADWVKREPAGRSPYLQYLSALIRAGQIDKANDLIARWLKEGRVPGELPAPVAARLQAAVSQAVGRGHNLSTDRMDDRWLAPLADLALFFARRPADLYVADTIMQSTFAQSDECRKLRMTFADLLTTDLDKLTPGQLQRFVEWALTDHPAVPPAVWKQVADGLHKRWSAEKQPEERNRLGTVLAQVLTNRATPPELIAFLHEQVREGPEPYRAAYAQKLFETLVAQPWSAEYEDEALALLDRLSSAADGHDALYIQVAALYRLTDRMVEGRYAALMAKVEHPEKLTRTELKAKQDEARKQARTGFADRLRQEAGKRGKALGPWLTVERVYLDVVLGRDLKQAAADCWAFLGDAPPAVQEASGEDEQSAALLDAVLRHRFLTTLASLATRKGAEPALAERLLTYVDRGVAADAEDGRWKAVKYRLLVALDRPKELEQALRQWVTADDPDSRWRVALGYLLAEQGRVADAVAQLEAAEKADELTPAAYRTLADWYLVLNQRERHDRAMVAAYQTLEEWRLSRLISAHINSFQRGDGHAPSELDPQVLLMFRALFEKSGNPAAYLWQLQQLYQATRDFRLLAVLADAVVGHSAGTVYPFLQGMQGIITDIHEEATVDELCAHLDAVRARAKTPVDRRALDLLEAQARRRAADLKNQAGPHAQAALSALRRAFEREWSDGEPPLMADLLAAFGAIPQEPLAAEQRRELDALHRAAPAGSAERLHIAHRYATTLWAYSRRNDAIDLLQAALKEHQDANDGVLPVAANEALTGLVSFFEAGGHFGRGEKLLLDQMRHPAHRQQSLWLAERLDRLYLESLRAGGEVSLGKGQTLYEALEPRLRDALGTDDHGHRRNLVNILGQVYRVGVDRKLTGVRDDLRAFAFKRLADVLQRQTSDYDSVVSDVAQTVHDLLGPADGVAFLLDRVENEPAWLRYNNQDGWSRHGWSLAQWRAEAMTLPPEVEARLLKFVLAELRRDLEARQARNLEIYDRRYGYYWKVKEADFAAAAEEVLARHAQSGAWTQYVAEYLARGVDRLGRAIEVLLAAHRQRLLEEAGQFQLVQYLHEANRHAESIPILEPLVGRRPEDLQYRVFLLRAYYHAGREADLLAQLKQADAFFHERDRWTENAMAALAGGTLDTALFAQSAAYFKEVIALHERTAPRRGIGDGVLSGYYAGLARAFSGLGTTDEAVKAAGGAVVSWGRDQRNRAQALGTLLQVLRDARDLEAYVASLDGRAAETGEDTPLVRKLAGQVYAERGKHREAITQLQLAADLQPHDAETHRLLVAEFDTLHDNEGAYRQLLHAVELSRRDIKLYQDMGKRLETLDRPREVERAYTSVVEMTPNESEGHALLGEIRQQQNRWPDAIAQWEQVARIRALEPTGLLKLAAAQVHERQWDDAQETVKKLRSRGWPTRFGNVDQQASELERQIAAGRKGRS
jgi:predicted Zn-dependent protease